MTQEHRREPKPPPPTSFEYFPETQRTNNSAEAWVRLVAPWIVGMAVAALGFRELALVVAVGGTIGGAIWRRHAPKRPAATLRVEDGVLHVTDADGKRRLTLALDALADVELDTKTVELVTESSGPVPELRFVQSTVGPAIDRARIVLVPDEEDDVPLTPHHLSHTDSLEWRRKMRLFLRAHGWVPDSERD